jgi:hypothetical protein
MKMVKELTSKMILLDPGMILVECMLTIGAGFIAYQTLIPKKEAYATTINTTKVIYIEQGARTADIINKTKTILYEDARTVTLIDERASLVREDKNAKSSIDEIIIKTGKVEEKYERDPRYYNNQNVKTLQEKLFNKYDAINNIVKKNVADSISAKYNAL